MSRGGKTLYENTVLVQEISGDCSTDTKIRLSKIRRGPRYRAS